MTHTVVLSSGGIDSTTALALCHAFGDQITAVTVDYGQRHARETLAAVAVAAHYRADHVAVQMPGLAAALGGSSLTDPAIPVPDGHYTDRVMAVTVVPNRNAILANIAAGVAAARKAGRVVLGVHAGDHPIYPDCRPEFVAALDSCVQAATAGGHPVRVEAPFLHATKAQIIGLAVRLAAPLHLTWSCYKGGAVHCGRCGTCVERAEAFDLAGVSDPTVYEGRP